MRRHNKADGCTLHRDRPILRLACRRLVTLVSSVALLIGTAPEPLQAQAPPPPPATPAIQPYGAPQATQPPAATQQADAQGYSVEQLDALLAPIALYPDQLLVQILMASTYPLQVVEAARWVDDPANKSLTGDALAAALAPLNWDPSVKSLVPFPQVLEMMNSQLDWLQQLGYAVSVQQSAVMDSVQRLRRQAQAAGQLQSTPQQVVTTQDEAVVIAPAQPNVVYVPTYNPTIVYGAWPYPAYPPIYLPPPPAYYVGTALAAGIAFGVGVGIVGGLWGWATPRWGYGGGYGSVNVNVNRYNNINVNRPPINNSNWRPPASNRPGGGGGYRPPAGGPVGRPGGATGLPANGIGRPNVSAPGNVVRPPAGMGPGNNRPPIGQGGANRPVGAPSAPGQGNRPGAGQGVGQGNRPAGPPSAPGQGNRPGAGQGASQGNRPGGSPAARPAPSTRPAGGGPSALGGMNDGRNASQYQNRGAQSRQQVSRPSGGGGGSRPQGGGGGGGGGGRPQGGGGNRR